MCAHLAPRVLLGVHCCFLLVLFAHGSMQEGADARPPVDDQSLEALQRDLSSSQCKGTAWAFVQFARHAHLAVAGLMSVSILLLPKRDEPSSSGAESQQGPAGAGTGSRSQAAAPGQPTNVGQPGFLAQGADVAHWEQAQDALERTCPLPPDWNNCCQYSIGPSAGVQVQAPPPYPVACTGAFYTASTTGEPLVSNNYPEEGPHFADWQALHEAGARSMASAPMFAEHRIIGVLSLASCQPHAFDRPRLVWLLALILAPFANLLQYTTQRMEMGRFIQCVMPGLLQQNHQRGKVTRRRSASSRRGTGSPQQDALRQGAVEARASGIAAGPSAAAVEAPATERAAVQVGHLPGSKQPKPRSGQKAPADGRAAPPRQPVEPQDAPQPTANAASALLPVGFDAGSLPAHLGLTPLGPAPPPDSDLGDFGDFFFNLVSMCIVYAYFSEAAVAGESQAAIAVSMCIAAVDIALLALRWLWYEQYITYGGTVLQVFQAYRLVVLPVANTWMSWSLLRKLGISPGPGVVTALAALFLLFLLLGCTSIRFFLHAPLQLASVLLAASATTDVCSRLLAAPSGVRCMGVVSALQLSLGVVLPAVLSHTLDARYGAKRLLPHVQAKRWLLQQP